LPLGAAKNQIILGEVMGSTFTKHFFPLELLHLVIAEQSTPLNRILNHFLVWLFRLFPVMRVLAFVRPDHITLFNLALIHTNFIAWYVKLDSRFNCEVAHSWLSNCWTPCSHIKLVESFTISKLLILRIFRIRQAVDTSFIHKAFYPYASGYYIRYSRCPMSMNSIQNRS